MTATLIGDDGKPILCWEPRPGVYFHCSAWTREEAQRKADEWFRYSLPLTVADVASHRVNGFVVGDPPVNHGAYI